MHDTRDAPPNTAPPKRDPLVFIGLAVVTISAAIGSFGALRGTALLAGWSRDMSPLLPVTVDATAVVASRVWLSPDTPTDRARRFARAVAFGAIAVSLLGNGIFHMAQAGYLRPGVWLVIGAGGISPLALAVVAHLAVLRGAVPAPIDVPERVEVSVPDQAREPVTVPAAPVVIPEPDRSPHPRVSRADDDRAWSELVEAAREVDARARHATGRPAGITKLRNELKIGQNRAQQVRDHLAGVPVDPPQTVPTHPVPHPQGVPGLAVANGYTR